MERIVVIRGDITRQAVDAVVNAANPSLLGGGGVDGAIHRAAGPGLLRECRRFGGCPTGEARITGGYDLPARYVIHTPGPIWLGGSQNEAELLANCYRNSLKIASMHDFDTIAFPSISTGIYHFPMAFAAEIAIRTIREFLREHEHPRQVRMVCFDDLALQTYTDALNGQL